MVIFFLNRDFAQAQEFYLFLTEDDFPPVISSMWVFYVMGCIIVVLPHLLPHHCLSRLFLKTVRCSKSTSRKDVFVAFYVHRQGGGALGCGFWTSPTLWGKGGGQLWLQKTRYLQLVSPHRPFSLHPQREVKPCECLRCYFDSMQIPMSHNPLKCDARGKHLDLPDGNDSLGREQSRRR